MKKLNGISTSSRRDLRKTDDYKSQVKSIKESIDQKYLPLEKNEKKLINKLILKIKKRTEVRKAISNLTSIEKMYIAQ